MRVVGIRRADCYSPNSVEKDRAILEEAVGHFDGNIIDEGNIAEISALDYLNIDAVFSMARSEEALAALKRLEKDGVMVINPAEGVRHCRRSALDAIMRENGVPVPSAVNRDSFPEQGCWLKRGDGAAQSHGDVVFCKDREEMARELDRFRSEGTTDVVAQAHIPGDLIKFYGVAGTGFFKVFYPTDDGLSKFGDEKMNGEAHHYGFSLLELEAVATKVSFLAGVPVYGGDAIVRSDGSFVIIDFNDWPSFSRCRESAADAIAVLMSKLMTEKNDKRHRDKKLQAAPSRIA